MDYISVTEEPNVLQNFLRLTERTETSENHVEVPANSSAGSPQARVWTNNIRLEKLTSYVDGSYKKVLPNPPGDFYVKLDETKIGIVNGGITIEWKRGNTSAACALK